MTSIRLQNFQGHKDTTVELSDTITAITGKSHNGKSSIVRAFKWMRDNKPKKPRFIHKGTTKAIVTVGKVRHERTEKTNKYFIEGKEEPYTALRGAVPEEVEGELNLGPDNIQGQHDPIFLLTDSPGKVAAKLSSLVDLEATTNSLKYIAAKKRGCKAHVETLRTMVDDTKSQLALLAHVDTAHAELILLESEDEAIALQQKKYTQLSKAVENATQAKLELSEIPDTKALKPAKKIVVLWDDVEEMRAEQNKLLDSITKVLRVTKELQYDPTKLLRKAKRLQRLHTEKEEIHYAKINAESIHLEVQGLRTKEDELTAKKEELMEGACPLCGRNC